jgi:uncharacterized protein (TIGR02391 family)
MFLQILYQIQYGTMKGHSWGIDSIVPTWMNQHYNITMSGQERQLTYEAIQELKSSGLIAQDATQHEDVFQVLTEKGKAIAEKNQDPDVYALRLEEVIKNPELLGACLSSFNEDDYETAILKAFRLVEIKVRQTAQLDPSDVGIVLMTKTFNTSNGKLTVKTCATTAEEEGVHSLFRGAIALYRNPVAHRSISYNDRIEAIQTLAFAELLLGILGNSTLKP